MQGIEVWEQTTAKTYNCKKCKSQWNKSIFSTKSAKKLWTDCDTIKWTTQWTKVTQVNCFKKFFKRKLAAEKKGPVVQ